jgi:hypothetical protein
VVRRQPGLRKPEILFGRDHANGQPISTAKAISNTPTNENTAALLLVVRSSAPGGTSLGRPTG